MRHFGYGHAKGYILQRFEETDISGGGAGAPPNALRDRDGNFILDRDGNFILEATGPRT